MQRFSLSSGSSIYPNSCGNFVTWSDVKNVIKVKDYQIKSLEDRISLLNDEIELYKNERVEMKAALNGTNVDRVSGTVITMMAKDLFAKTELIKRRLKIIAELGAKQGRLIRELYSSLCS